MPKERPIIFSAPMVRAILEGRKTQTRRALKFTVSSDCISFSLLDSNRWRQEFLHEGTRYPKAWNHQCPYGAIGDRLWVREGFLLDERNRKDKAPQEVIYGATPEWAMNHLGNVERVRFLDGSLVSSEEARTSVDTNRFWHRKPSIYMPRWASRITLELTGVRVERLQDISKADALAEGISVLPLQSADDPSAWYQSAPGIHQERTAQASYAALWESINGKGSWSANPWVWVLSFKRVEAAQ